MIESKCDACGTGDLTEIICVKRSNYVPRPDSEEGKIRIEWAINHSHELEALMEEFILVQLCHKCVPLYLHETKPWVLSSSTSKSPALRVYPPATDLEGVMRCAPRMEQFSFDERQPYVYFLFRGSRLTYVGQTVNFESRILQHRSTREFDGVTRIPIPGEHLDNVEAACIRLFKPPENDYAPVGDPENDLHVLAEFTGLSIEDLK